MNILVTVGTTSFDLLVQRVDELASSLQDKNFIFQVGNGKYKVQNGRFFSFTDDIESFYKDADVVITHAGAGSIYRLLELRKKIIVAPNFERVDKHQSDISFYMEKNGHLLVAWKFDEIREHLITYDSFSPKPYLKDNFHKFHEIADFIKGSL